jgi:hypothetical protein
LPAVFASLVGAVADLFPVWPLAPWGGVWMVIAKVVIGFPFSGTPT